MVIVLLYYNISLHELPWENKVFISIIRANPACRVWLVFSPSNWFVLTLTLLYIRLEMLRDYILYPLFCVWLFYNILSRTILMVVLLVFLFHCHASVLAWSILETNLWRRTVLHNIRFNVGKMTSTISLHPPPKFNITQTSVHTINETTCTFYRFKMFSITVRSKHETRSFLLNKNWQLISVVQSVSRLLLPEMTVHSLKYVVFSDLDNKIIEQYSPVRLW